MMKIYVLIWSLFTLVSCEYALDWIDQIVESNRKLIEQIDEFKKKYNSTDKLIAVGVLDSTIHNQNVDFEKVFNLIQEEEGLCEKLKDIDAPVPDSLEELRQSFDLDSTEGHMQCSIAKGLAKFALKKVCSHTEDQLMERAESIFKERPKYEGQTLDKDQARKNIQNLTKHCE